MNNALPLLAYLVGLCLVIYAGVLLAPLFILLLKIAAGLLVLGIFTSPFWAK